MKLHSPQFKENIKMLGRELDVKIIYGEEELTTEELNRVSIRYSSEFFRTIMKEVEFETSTKITEKQWVNVQAGIKVDGEYEYIDYGNYYIAKEPEYNADTESYTYIAYDKMIESMVSYDDNPLAIEYPISYKDYIIEICNKLNWDYNLPVSFPNMNTEINEDIYIDLGLTYRDVLDDICPCSMGNFINDGEFKIIYPNETGDIIDDEFLKADNVVIGNKIGPINSLVLSRAEDGDTINRQDTDSIVINGIKEIKIKDNILLSTTYRENFIDGMFDNIKGFEYYSIDVASTGLMYYEPLDKFTINHESINYPTIILNSELNIDDGIEEILYSPELEESVTNYTTSAQTDKAKKMATIVAYKNEAKITLLTTSVETVSEELTNATTLTATTEQAKTFHLTDSADANCKDIELYGESTQATRSGKNLLQLIPGTITYKGVTVTIDDDGLITLNGTVTDNISVHPGIKITNGLEGTGVISEIPSSWLNQNTNIKGTYTLEKIYVGGSTSYGVAPVPCSYQADSTRVDFLTVNGSGVSNKTITDPLACVVLYLTTNGTTFENYKMYLQVEEGTKSQVSSYEQYGVQPSPDYPSDIESVESPISITSTGENNTSTVSIPLLHPMRSLPNGTRDRIYYDNGKWYDEQKIGTITLNGSEAWIIGYNTDTFTNVFELPISGIKPYQNGTIISTYCDKFKSIIANNWQASQERITQMGNSNISIRININRLSTNNLAGFKTWLGSNNILVQYELATPIITEITDTSTIEALENIRLYSGITNITSDAPMILTYYRDTDFTNNFETVEEAKKKENSNIEKFAEIEITNEGIISEVNEIRTDISDNYTTKSSVTSEITQNVEEININLKQVGGVNLIKDSTLRLGYEGNIKTGTVTIEQNKEINDNTISKSAIKVNTGSLKFAPILIKQNEDYTFSCLIYKLALSNVQIKITSAIEQIYNIECEHNKFIDFEFPLNSSAGQVTIELLCDNNYALFADNMFNKGGKLGYQSYQGEIIGENYKFSNGLEITNTVTNSKFIANSESVKIINSETNKVKADFNGENSTMDRVTIQERINIGPLRYTKTQNGHVIVTFDEED